MFCHRCWRTSVFFWPCLLVEWFSRSSLDRCGLLKLRYVPRRLSDVVWIGWSGWLQRLYDRLWFFVTESLLAFTIFRDDFDIPFALMFGFLLFVKSFHWLASDRIEWVRVLNLVPWFHSHMQIQRWTKDLTPDLPSYSMFEWIACSLSFGLLIF